MATRVLTNAVFGLLLLLVVGPKSRATPIGIYDDSIDDHVEITFQFAPIGTSPPHTLSLGLSSGIVSGTGYAGCNFDLSDGSGVISSSTINGVFGCQGSWASDDGSGVTFLLIDSEVDLSGIAAGDVGTIVMRPTFLSPGSVVSLDSPSVIFNGSTFATILSQDIFSIPEPSAPVLLAMGVIMFANRRLLGA